MIARRFPAKVTAALAGVLQPTWEAGFSACDLVGISGKGHLLWLLIDIRELASFADVPDVCVESGLAYNARNKMKRGKSC